MKKYVFLFLALAVYSYPSLGIEDKKVQDSLQWQALHKEFSHNFKEYYDPQNYSSGTELVEELKRLARTTFGKDHIKYVKSLHKAGELYNVNENYIKAEKNYQQAIEIYKENGMHHEDPEFLGKLFNDVGVLYSRMGLYKKAELYLLKGKRNRKKYRPNSASGYGNSLHSLAWLYRSMGRFEEAIPLARKTNQMWTSQLDGVWPASSMDNLAFLLMMDGQMDEAKKLLFKAKKRRKRLVGKVHPLYSYSLNYIARFYIENERYDKADSLYRESLQILERTRGQEHPDYASALVNIGRTCESKGQMHQADSFYRKAKHIQEKILDKNHPSYISTLRHLAGLKARMDSLQRSQELYLQCYRKKKQHYQNQSNFLAESERLAFLDGLESLTGEMASLIQDFQKSNSSLTTTLYNSRLFLSGQALRTTKGFRKFALAEGTPDTVKRQYQQYISLKRKISDLLSLPVNKRWTDVDSLKEVANRLEKRLTLVSHDFRKQFVHRDIKWQDIRQTLEADEAAIEFICYSDDYKNVKDSTQYAALILTKNAKQPRFIPLFTEEQLQQQLHKPTKGQREQQFINNLYKWDGKGEKLYQLLWSRMESHLKNKETVYYSTAGLLHRLSFKAVRHPDGPYLSDQYNLVHLNTTRKLVIGARQPKYTSVMMFGGIRYAYNQDTSTQSKENNQSTLAMKDIPGYEQTRTIRGSFHYLEGSLQEVKQIGNLFDEQVDYSVITGNSASESTFKQLSGNSPKVLHISTHGFFFPDNLDSMQSPSTRSSEPSFQYMSNPLFRSGLAFAGSNYTWKHGYNPYEREDGILTAYEISNMDLSNTDLVVLSACETGLGEIKGSEGVYGMQRAFRMAGVDYLIMSLWKVPDEETRILMEDFYDNWLSGQPIRQAFRNAQQKLAEDYPPYFWASFVLVGGGQEEETVVSGDGADWWKLILIILCGTTFLSILYLGFLRYR